MGLFVEQKKPDVKQQAVRPNAFFTIPQFITNEKAKDEGVTDEERVLSAGFETDFWRTLQAYINDTVLELDEVNNQAIMNGAKLEEIGQNTIVINLTKGILQKIFEKVADAHDAVEAANGRK